VSIKRYADEPGFVLHRYDWSESSLILDVFTRHFGRVALVAKGAKRPTSQLRPVLLPLQPLLLAWAGDAEVRTLKAAHWRGGHVMPVGESLLSGTYFNEMLLKLLARDDPHPVLFDGYALAVQQLAHRTVPDAAVLRAFELLLLREVGYLPSLSEDGSSLAPLEPDAWYVLETEGGLALVPVTATRCVTRFPLAGHSVSHDANSPVHVTGASVSPLYVGVAARVAPPAALP
jgi:DNA repair protein RecO (recombination protein O)